MHQTLFLTLTVILLVCRSVYGHCHKPKPMQLCNKNYCDANWKRCEYCCFCKKSKNGKMKCHRFNKEHVKNEDDMKDIIATFEGCKLGLHGGEDDPTIGIGFSLSRGDAEEVIERLFPGADYDNLRSGTMQLTKEQAWTLYCFSFDEAVGKAKRALGVALYDSLTFNVKTATVNGFYRGDIGPKTIQLIKDGKWDEVADEYIDHDGYRKAKKEKNGGIVRRMDCNAWQYGKHDCH